MEIKMLLMYRQTYNQITKNWVVPKRRVSKTKWEVVKNAQKLISKKYGYAGAIWRMKKVFDRKKNPDGSRVWNTEIKTVYYPKSTPEKPKSTYAITYLTCRRTGYGFSRSM